jgi:hypothetical protein
LEVFEKKNFSPRFDEKMKSKMAAMRSLIMQNEKKKKNVFPGEKQVRLGILFREIIWVLVKFKHTIFSSIHHLGIRMNLFPELWFPPTLHYNLPSIVYGDKLI